jgi:hypothetical protein
MNGPDDFIGGDDGGQEKKVEKCPCGGEFEFSSYCGAYVCNACENHKGLARCYCTWTASGNGNGYQELQEAGEVIEPEEPDDLGEVDNW